MLFALDLIGFLIIASFLGTLFLLNQFARIPMSMQSIGIVFALVLWGIASLLQKQLVYRHYRWNGIVGCFTLYLWIACLWSFNPVQSIRYTIVFTTGALWLVLLSSYPFQKKHIVALYGMMMFGAVWQGIQLFLPHAQIYYRAFLYGVLRGDYMLFRTLAFPRIESSIGGSNSLGGWYAVLFTLCAPVIIFQNYFWEKASFWRNFLSILLQILGAACLIVFLFVVVMSGSRGSFISVALSLLLIWLLRQAWYKAFLYLLVGGASLFVPSIRRGIQYVYSGIADKARYIIWQNSWEISKLVPLTGVGLGNFQPVYTYLFQEPFQHAHNIFLNVLVELGYPGLIGFVWLAVSFMVFGLERCRQQKDRFWYGVELGLTVTVFGYLLRCLVDYTI